MVKLTLSRVVLLLICTLSFTISFSQQKRITGTVRDDKGTPLIGATVAAKNTRVATTTDASGAFIINVPQNANALVVSYVGMVTQEFPIGSNSVVAISLVQSSTSLTDVVIVGYGRARRANLTTAQTSVTSKDIEKTVNTTLEQAIQGRAAGVYITQNSGQPGGGMSVVIRGISTINGNTEPLYVIDGVQILPDRVTNSSNPLAGLNPSDIEDIQIL